MKALNVISRPQSAFAELGAAPDLTRGFGVVLLVALLFTGCELAAAALAGNPTGGLALTLSLPLLFLAFWAVAGWLIDAAAGLLGRQGRLRAYLAVSGWAFPPLLVTALLAVIQGALSHWSGGAALAAALTWTALPVLFWFLVLTAIAVHAVYRVPPLNAAAMAMLPFAALTAALLVLLVALAALHAGGLI